jgi:pimeloyl-ACP methyl ester carboxylesterase
LQCSHLDGYVPKANEKDQVPLTHYSNLAKQGQIDTVRDEWMNHPLMHIPTSNLALKKQVREIINCYSGEDLTDDMTERMAYPINISENLQQITIPTLIIEGSEETAMLKDVANKLHDSIYGSKKIVITGGGHLINLIEPEKYNRAVIDFLQSLNHI